MTRTAKLCSAVDILGNTTSIKYDTRGDVIETTLTSGLIVRSVYDLLGQVIYTTDPYDPQSGVLPNGTFTVYDALGREVKTERVSGLLINVTTTPAGNNYSSFVSDTAILSTMTTVYAPNGQVSSTTDAAGATTTYEYNSLGQETASIDGEGNKTTFAYDQFGNLSQVTDPLGNKTQYQYDSLNRLTKTILPDGTTIIDAYDSQGNLTAETDQFGNTTQYDYNSLGQLTDEILPAVADPGNGGALTQPHYSFAYDSLGDLLQVTDPNGHVTKYTYDPYGDQLTETLPDGETNQDVYNALGQLYRQIDFDGQVTQYSYNSHGQLTEEDYFQTLSQANAGTPAYSITYTFDTLGQLQNVNDPRIGQTTYQYDSNGLLTELDSPEGVIHYRYDQATGDLLEESTDFTDIQYSYGKLGELSSTTATLLNGQVLTAPLVTTYSYTALGSRQTEALPNGDTVSYVYDLNNNLVQEINKDPSGVILSEYDYVNDALGNRVQAIESTRQADGSLSQTKITYQYDALGRLTEEKSQDLTGNAPQFTYTTDYTYDLAGNRHSMVTTNASGIATTTYTYNGDDELLTSIASDGTVTTYSYDANGSELQEQVNGKTVEQYTYDLENRLQTATAFSTTPGGQSQVTTTTYYYDVDGNKVRAQTSVSVGGSAATTTTTDYLVDEQNPSGFAQVLEERDGTTHTPNKTYIIGDDIIAQIAKAAASLRFFIYDGHGSVRLLTNSVGVITDRFAFSAFGNPIGFNPATAATNYLFSGQQYDPVAAQYYMRARLYDPSTGRFTQTDPLPGLTHDALSLHRYVYSESDPVNLSDPSGQKVNLLNNLTQGILGLAALGSVFGLLGGFGLLANFYLNAAVTLYAAYTVVSDIIGVFETLPYIATLKQNIGKGLVIPPNSASAAAVLQLRKIGPYVIGLDFGVLALTIGLAIADEAIPFAAIVNLYVTFLQLAANALFNGLVAVDTMTILNIKYSTMGKKGRHGKAASYSVNTTLTGRLDGVEILGETWFGFSADPWEILRDATGVILGAAALNGKKANSEKIAEQMKEAFDEVKKGLNSDYLRADAKSSGNVYKNGEPLTPGFLRANLSSGTLGPLNPSDLISSADPRLAPLLAEALALWQAALGQPVPVTPIVDVSALPAGVLGETLITGMDAENRPTGYIVVLSPDAAGQGWYVDGSPEDNTEFSQSLSTSALQATPGLDAFGHFDLLTTLLHEIGHVEGFIPDNPGFERYVQTVDGAQAFVAPGVTALLVDKDQELDFGGYPGDLLSATLDTSVRELPSQLDVRIIEAITAPIAPAQCRLPAPQTLRWWIMPSHHSRPMLRRAHALLPVALPTTRWPPKAKRPIIRSIIRCRSR